jgi:TonB family protein
MGLADEVGKASDSCGPVQGRAPEYPRDSDESGTSRFRIHVNNQGRPTDVRLTRATGSEQLDEAALRAVRSWAFTSRVELIVEGELRFHFGFSFIEPAEGEAQPKTPSAPREDSLRPLIAEMATSWGSVQNVRFIELIGDGQWHPYKSRRSPGIVQLRWERYEVTQEHQLSEWSIAVDHTGMIWAAEAVKRSSATTPGSAP